MPTNLHSCTTLQEVQELISAQPHSSAKQELVNSRLDVGVAPILAIMGNKSIAADEKHQMVIFLLSLRFEKDGFQVDPNVTKIDGKTPAHICQWGPVMTALVEHPDFNPNALSTEGNTPLMQCIVAQKDKDLAVRLLASDKINLNIINPNTGKNALQMAEAAGLDGYVQLLRPAMARSQATAMSPQTFTVIYANQPPPSYVPQRTVYSGLDQSPVTSTVPSLQNSGPRCCFFW